MLKSQPPVSQNVTTSRERVFKEVIKVQWGHMAGFWSSVTGILVGREDWNTDGGTTIWTQGEGGHQQNREGVLKEDFALILDYWLPDWEKINFWCFSHLAREYFILSALANWNTCLKSRFVLKFFPYFPEIYSHSFLNLFPPLPKLDFLVLVGHTQESSFIHVMPETKECSVL